VTHLRKIMLEELQRRHYSEGTTHYYIRHVERLARHFHCSPDRLGPQHIRQYQAYLFTKRKLSPGSVTNHLCALRFFYIQTLKKAWSIADTPYPKKTHRLPTILSQEEVAQLIDAAPTAKIRQRVAIRQRQVQPADSSRDQYLQAGGRRFESCTPANRQFRPQLARVSDTWVTSQKYHLT
jgi:site-specific recombinase XerD